MNLKIEITPYALEGIGQVEKEIIKKYIVCITWVLLCCETAQWSILRPVTYHFMEISCYDIMIAFFKFSIRINIIENLQACFLTPHKNAKNYSQSVRSIELLYST